MTDVTFSDLDDLDTAPTRSSSSSVEITKCIACCGSGTRTYGYTNITTYPCGVCKGKGTVSSTRLRNIDRAKRAEATRLKNAQKSRQEFIEANPEYFKWMRRHADSFEFARSLLEQLDNRGKLSEKQMAAIQKCLDRETEWAAEKVKAQQADSIKVSGAGKIMEAFNRAVGKGIKRPKIRVHGVVFSLAPPTGRNAGSIYVQADRQYAGKITKGTFIPTGIGHESGLKDFLARVFESPMESAIAYGKESGNCSCCGRELTDPNSLAAGIGPICAENYFG